MNAWRLRLAVLLAAWAALACGPAARAGAVFFAGKLTDGEFIPDAAHKGPCYTVRYSAITARIDGSSAETEIAETIAGPTGGAVKAVCVIPLPAGADGKSAKVALTADGDEGRALPARFLPADEAQQLYETLAKGTGAATVVSLGGKPALLVESFDLAAKTELCISFRQAVRQDRGVSFYDCPMPAVAWAAGPVARLSLTAEVAADKPLRAMFSPSHTATVERDGLRKARVRVRADNYAGRDDFTLCYVADRDELGLRVLAHRGEAGEDGYFLLVGCPTGSEADREALPKDVLFVLDTSGSMRGEKIEQARAAVDYCLGHLNDGDRFNIVTFGTEVRSFRDDVVGSGKATVAAAREFVERVRAHGRTNVSGALAKALAGQGAAGRLRIMIFLTDGTPTAGELVPGKIVEQVAAGNPSGARIFVMGVGHDVNAHLLDKLAETTQGSCEYVEPDQDIDVKIATLYDRLSNPVLTDVKVAFGELRPTAVFPKNIGALFIGSEIMVAGRYRKGGPQTVTLSGTLAGKEVAYTCRAELPDKTARTANEFVAPLWAARKIGYLLREIRLNGESKELIEEIVRLSTKFGIITEYTNFLATVGAASGAMPAAEKVYEEAADRLRAAREQQAGRWAVNQAVNELALQNRTVAAGAANVFRDRRGKVVANDYVRQVGRRVFYLRDGQWVDADQAGKRKTRRVALFSKEYFDLLRTHKDFARSQRIGWNVEMNVGAERIVVEKDGKVRDEQLRDRVRKEQRPAQQLRNFTGPNQQIRQVRQNQLRPAPKPEEQKKNEKAPK